MQLKYASLYHISRSFARAQPAYITVGPRIRLGFALYIQDARLGTLALTHLFNGADHSQMLPFSAPRVAPVFWVTLPMETGSTWPRTTMFRLRYIVPISAETWLHRDRLDEFFDVSDVRARFLKPKAF